MEIPLIRHIRRLVAAHPRTGSIRPALDGLEPPRALRRLHPWGLHTGFIFDVVSMDVLSVLDDKLRKVLWGLASEFAYLAVVGTSVIPPCSLLRRRLERVVRPELLSLLATKVGGDVPDVLLNSALGMRLGGVPKCELMYEALPELYQLCVALRLRGREPMYKVVSEVVVPLAVSASAAGYEEGDVLLASYRAAAYRGERDLAAVMRYFDRWPIVARF
ncbi:MAG: hypothetical protein ACP5H5_06220 [Pyrobaculum sp.]